MVFLAKLVTFIAWVLLKIVELVILLLFPFILMDNRLFVKLHPIILLFEPLSSIETQLLIKDELIRVVLTESL